LLLLQDSNFNYKLIGSLYLDKHDVSLLVKVDNIVEFFKVNKQITVLSEDTLLLTCKESLSFDEFLIVLYLEVVKRYDV